MARGSSSGAGWRAAPRSRVKWYRPLPHADQIRNAIAGLTAGPGPTRRFAWPLDLVESDRVSGFGYVMPHAGAALSAPRPVISAIDPLPFRTAAGIGRRIADAFAALHAAGLCYRDISLGNLLVDPGAARSRSWTTTMSGTDGSAVFVKGRSASWPRRCSATRSPPSTVSDLHSLAVILFFLLVHGHPLEGSRPRARATAGTPMVTSPRPVSPCEHFGRSPLFVFDPDDHSNRPEPGDPGSPGGRSTPAYLRDLFSRTFSVGLTDASSAAGSPRVSGGGP